MLAFLVAALPVALLSFWPAVLAVFVLVVAGSRCSSASPRTRGALAVSSIAFSLCACLVIALREAAIPANNRLTRDVVAFVLIGGIAPSLACLGAGWHRLSAAWLRVMVSLAMGMLPLLASPAILLLVHCTSGDCL